MYMTSSTKRGSTNTVVSAYPTKEGTARIAMPFKTPPFVRMNRIYHPMSEYNDKQVYGAPFFAFRVILKQ